MRIQTLLTGAAIAGLLLTSVPAVAANNSGGLLEPIGAIGSYMDDAGLTAQIKGEFLAQEGLPSTDIHVTTNDLVVTLEGTVDTPQQRALAEDMVRRIDVVKGVNNRLRVR